MSTYSPKQTRSGRSASKDGTWVVRHSETCTGTPNKFAGMSKNVEEVRPVVIRGYKTRG